MKRERELKQAKSACALLPEIVESAARRMLCISKKRGVLDHRKM